MKAKRVIRNDGTYAGKEIGEILAKKGEIGYVVTIGTFLQQFYIYGVEFVDSGNRVGMKRKELEPIQPREEDVKICRCRGVPQMTRMIEPRLPKYQWGQRFAPRSIFVNDGSFPDAEEESLLVAAGAASARSSRSALTSKSNTPIYLVEFGEKSCRVS